MSQEIWEQCQIPKKDIVFKKFSGLWCNGQPHVEHKNIIKTVSLRGGVFLPTKQSR